MYEALLNSKTRPFRATPDKQFYFPGESIESARQTAVRATIRAEGPVLILGGAGLGKSLLASVIAEDLAARFDVVMLHAAHLCSRKALLQSILFELDMPYRDLSEGELRLSILDRLEPSPETAPDGVLCIVDEAHTLPIKLLDELRLITNFTRDSQPRVRLVLLGSLKLEDVFAQPQLDSFNQRLAARCYLQPMSRQETHQYIKHQLTTAGIEPADFITTDALDTAFSATDGLPRLTNQIMDHATVLAIEKNQAPVSSSLIEEAWADLQQLPAPWHAGEEARSSEGTAVEFGTLSDSDDTASFEFGPSIHDDAPQTTDDGELISHDFSQTSERAGDLDAAPVAEESPAIPEPSTEQTEGASGFAAEQHPDLLDVEWAVMEAEAQTAPAAPAQEDPTSDQPNFFSAFAPETGAAEMPSVDPAQATAPDPEASADVADETEPVELIEQEPASDQDPSAIPISIQMTNEADAETTVPGAGFFEGRATDEKMLAYEDEQSQYDSMGVWENDPPLAGNETPAPGADNLVVIDSLLDQDSSAEETQEPRQAASTKIVATTASSVELFGDDFEEELAISEVSLRTPLPPVDTRLQADDALAAAAQPVKTDTIPQAESVTSEEPAESPIQNDDVEATYYEQAVESVNDALSLPGEPQTLPDEPSQADYGSAEYGPAEHPSAVALDGSHAASPETAVNTQPTGESPTDVLTTPLAINAPEPEVDLPQDIAANTEPVTTDAWTMDIVSSDVQDEVNLQTEIEDIVSQLNFSAFSVEPYSVEQLPDATPTIVVPEDSIRTGKDDEVYLLHRAEGYGEQARGEENIFTQVAEYDDDRDLLVIEEEVPVTSRSPEAVSNTEKTKPVGYSQLFAKLRR